MKGKRRSIYWVALCLLFGGAMGAQGQDLQIRGRITFYSNRDGNEEIYLMNADGSSLSNLTGNSSNDQWGHWSPDGTKVIFRSNRAGSNDIFVVNIDGSGLTNLTSSFGGHDDQGSWSPDGSKIVFDYSDGQIYTMNADGSGRTQLTNTGGNSFPVWSPDGSKIAFMSNRSGNNDIWVMGSDGSNPQNLSNNPAGETNPSWSPDGSKIAFHSTRDGQGEIYVMNADGSGQTRLTNNSVWDEFPWWSPDGTKIAYYSAADIYTMDADGGNKTNITNNGSDNGGPTWDTPFRIGSTTNTAVSRAITVDNKGSATLTVSNITSSDGQFVASPTSFSVNAGSSQSVTITFTPNSAGTKYGTLTITSNDLSSSTAKLTVNATGTGAAAVADLQIRGKITFTSTRDRPNDQNGWEVYSMNADGSGITRLTNNGIQDYSDGFTPDGTKILFLTNRDGQFEEYSMNATDGTSPTRLTTNGASDAYATPSPDGTKIAFFSNRDGTGSIYSANTDGSGVVRLTTGEDNSPSWSPDGTKIAFHSIRPGNAEIYVMDANGASQTRLTNNSAADYNPTWSPDGTKIVFDSNRDGNPEIYMMDANGANQTRITNNSASDSRASWSPDGTKISFVSDRDGNQELYSMNADGSSQTRLTNHGQSDNSASWEQFRLIGTANTGASVSRTMTIENKGNGALSVSNITSSDGQFAVNPTSFSVPAGGSQEVRVTFTPTSTGPQYSTLTITSNDATSPTAKLTVNGTGTQATNVVATKLAFSTQPSGSVSGVVLTGQPVVQAQDAAGNKDTGFSGTVTLSLNTGPGSLSGLTLSGITVTAGEATISGLVYTATADQQLFSLHVVDDASSLTAANSTSITSDVVATQLVFTTQPSPLTVTSGVNMDFTTDPVVRALDAANVLDTDFTGTVALAETGVGSATYTGNSVSAVGGVATFTGLTLTYTATADQQTFKLAADSGSLSQGLSSDLTANRAAMAPAIALSSTALSFGNVNVGLSGTQTFTVANTGSAALTVSAITVGGTDVGQFALSPATATVAVGDSLTVTVTFAPTAVGAKTASLSIAHNAAGSPAIVSLTGLGVPAGIPTQGLVAYYPLDGNVDDQSGNGNHGTLGNPFSPSYTDDPAMGRCLFNDAYRNPPTNYVTTPLAGIFANSSISVWYYPRSGDEGILIGTHRAFDDLGNFELYHGRPRGYAGFHVNGIDGWTDNLFSAEVQQNAWHHVVLMNEGGTHRLYVDGQLANSYTGSAILDSYPLVIGSSPSLAGSFAGKLSKVRVYTRPLAGSEVQSLYTAERPASVAAISLSSTSLAVGSVDVGATGIGTFAITNTGTASLAVTGIAVGGADASQFTVSPATATVAAGDSLRVTVSFAPTSAGAKSASLSIAHNAAGSPSSVNLSGTGVPRETRLWVKCFAGARQETSPLRIRVGRAVRFEVWAFSAPDSSDLRQLTNYTWQVPPRLGKTTGLGRLELTTVAGINDTILFRAQGARASFRLITTPHSIERLAIEPAAVTLTPGQKQSFRARAYDQYGNEVSGKSFGWHAVGGIGTIDPHTGVFEAARQPGEGYVIAVVSGVIVFGDAAAGIEGSSKVVVKAPLPARFALGQNTPNPFNPGTLIGFELPVESRVRLTVYNLSGQLVAELADQVYVAGVHQVEWQAVGLPSGVYIYQLEAGAFRTQRKMTLLR